MADLDMEISEPAAATSELLNRPDKTFSVTGQAGFFAVALHLDIPILSSARNVNSEVFPSASSTGASFEVSSFIEEFKANIGQDFVNSFASNWFDPLNSAVALGNLAQRSFNLRYVTKRIITAPGSTDCRQLASIVNEMRVLSNRTLRSSRNIVSLLAISWFEPPSSGRFWPQLLLESADLGTLSSFVSSKELNFQTKTILGLDIISGLQFLHFHGIVHCDLKPLNILVFSHTSINHATSLGIEPITAKICDFGSAVILSDYNVDKPFQARIGTFPWLSPELDLSLPIENNLLHKTDIFSYGLVMASVFMDGAIPYEGLNPEEVISLKLGNAAGWQNVIAEVRSKRSLSEKENPFVSMLLLQTVLPNPDDRFSIDLIMSVLKLALLFGLSARNSERLSSEESIAASGPGMPEVIQYVQFL